MANQSSVYATQTLTSLIEIGWIQAPGNTVTKDNTVIEAVGIPKANVEINAINGEINHNSSPANSDAALLSLTGLVSLRYKRPQLYMKLRQIIPALPFADLSAAEGSLASIVIACEAGYIQFVSACQRPVPTRASIFIMLREHIPRIPPPIPANVCN